MYLFSRYPCWSETFLRQDLQMLRNLGHSVAAASLYPGDCECHPEWPDVQVLSSSGKPRGNAASSCGGGFRRLVAGIVGRRRYSELSLWRHKSLLKKLHAFAQEHGETHIHAEFADLAALLACRASELWGYTYSIGIHAFDIHASRHDLERMFAGATAVTVCNQAAADAFSRQFPQYQKKLHLIYHGVNLERWHFQPCCEDCTGRILFVGRLVPKKGIPLLLRALAMLRQGRWPEARVTLLGDGPQREELVALARELHIEQSVAFFGRGTAEQVQAEMSASDCLCVPSVVTPNGDRDGIPNVILEALASGLPVVATQVGSIPEVIGVDTGWPVCGMNGRKLIDSLVEQLDAVLTQRQTAYQRARKGRQLIEERFDAQKLASQRAAVILEN